MKQLFDDLQLKRASTPGEFLYLSADCARVDNVVFNVLHVQWDSKKQDNVTLSEKHIDAVDFSEWWLGAMQAGWRANWRRA